NRFHLGILTITLLAPPSWAFFALYFLLGTAIEAMLAVWVWKRTALSATRRIERYLPLVLGGCLLASHLIHWWAEAHYYVPVTAFTRYLPLYFPYRDAGNLWKLGLLDRNQAREQGLVAALARPPGLMDMFRQHRYQLRLFASSPVYRGAGGLDQTALARIPNLRLETSSPYPGSSGRDRSLTDEWYEWLSGRDPSRPFFGFLY